jgi:anti-anti-sigma regulatory factor
MTVRISTTPEASRTIVSVAGRLDGSAARELLLSCHSTEGELVLDLTDLRSVDPEGIEAIRKLTREKWELRGVSPFIRLQLEGDQPSAE